MRLERERARVDGGVRKATARARPRACASAVRGQRARRGERWRSLARATRARAARRSGERPGARRVLAASGRLTSFLRRDSPKIYRWIEHTVVFLGHVRPGGEAAPPPPPPPDGLGLGSGPGSEPIDETTGPLGGSGPQTTTSQQTNAGRQEMRGGESPPWPRQMKPRLRTRASGSYGEAPPPDQLWTRPPIDPQSGGGPDTARTVRMVATIQLSASTAGASTSSPPGRQDPNGRIFGEDGSECYSASYPGKPPAQPSQRAYQRGGTKAESSNTLRTSRKGGADDRQG